MQGPTQRWDQPPDPRESTISMPRIDPSSLAGHVSEPAAAAYDDGTGMELPGFGDPYALPVRAGEPPQAHPGRAGAATPRLIAAPAAPPTAELAVTPERVATPEPAVASAPEPSAPPPPATPEPAEPDELVVPETPGQPGAISRGTSGQPPRRARRPAPGAAGKPPPGSIAELRGRLERLPDGHPSSPYDDAGWLKPSPTRLRQLELGLPARLLGTPSGYSERFGIDPDDDWLNDGLPAPTATGPRADTGTVGDQPPETAAAPAVSNGHPDSDNGDSRLRWEKHPYADSAEPDQAANGSGSAELALTRWPARDTAGERGPGPDDQRNGHHPGRSDVSRRGDEAATARPRLTPELRELVDRIMAACRAAEGQAPRGGYGTSGLTPALRRIAAQLPAGGLAPGSEADTLKAADRFATRLARLIDRQPGRPPAELAATIADGIRYAFTFPAAGYTEGTLLVHRKLKAQGFDLEARRNQWDSREYKGIFTRWRDPAHGLTFEVQFHTADSWAVIKQTHDAYLQITDPAMPAAERARLRARQAAAAATVSPPPGSLEIADFRAETR